MHSRQLVELAAVVSAHGPLLVAGSGRIPDGGVEQYWVASKCRLDRWGRSLRAVAEAGEARPAKTGLSGDQVRALFEEVLTGEMLTRVWAAVLCLHDARRGTDRAEPVASSVLVGHLEARHRVLTALVRNRGIDAESAVKLNHLRRRTERWTDLLVGYLGTLGDVGEFAIDAERAGEFGEDLGYHRRSPGGRAAWPLLLASLRETYGCRLRPESPNADLNGQIASSILSCFEPELFDSLGLLRSLWLERLSHAADDAVGLIDDLLAPAERTPAEQPGPTTVARLAGRMGRFGT